MGGWLTPFPPPSSSSSSSLLSPLLLLQPRPKSRCKEKEETEKKIFEKLPRVPCHTASCVDWAVPFVVRRHEYWVDVKERKSHETRGREKRKRENTRARLHRGTKNNLTYKFSIIRLTGLMVWCVILPLCFMVFTVADVTVGFKIFAFFYEFVTHTHACKRTSTSKNFTLAHYLIILGLHKRNSLIIYFLRTLCYMSMYEKCSINKVDLIFCSTLSL